MHMALKKKNKNSEKWRQSDGGKERELQAGSVLLLLNHPSIPSPLLSPVPLWRHEGGEEEEKDGRWLWKRRKEGGQKTRKGRTPVPDGPKPRQTDSWMGRTGTGLPSNDREGMSHTPGT